MPAAMIPGVVDYDRRSKSGLTTRERDMPFIVGFGDWRHLVKRIGREWWPLRFYPRWGAEYEEITAKFVAGCLLWEPRTVPEEWIDRARSGIREVAFDPELIIEHPYVQRLHAEIAALGRLLKQQVEGTNPILAEDLVMVLWDVQQEAIAAERRADRGNPYDEISIAYVPVVPGITKTDWGSLETTVIRHFSKSENTDWLRKEARELFDYGTSKAGIARLLGVSRRAVYRLLETARS